MNFTAKKLTTMAMFTAISIVLVSLIHFPIFPAATFLEYDPADIPIFIATFLFGPFTGLILTLLVSVIQGLTVSAQSGIIGIIMHFVATGSFTLLAGFLYKKMPSKKGLLFSSIAGALLMTIVMVLWNLILTPIFMGAPRAAVVALMLPAIIPFNLIKAGLNAALAAVIYQVLSQRGLVKKLQNKTI